MQSVFVDTFPNSDITLLISKFFQIGFAESNRLLIRNADAGDSGTYKCAAVNAYSSAFSSINVIVEGKCTLLNKENSVADGFNFSYVLTSRTSANEHEGAHMITRIRQV